MRVTIRLYVNLLLVSSGRSSNAPFRRSVAAVRCPVCAVCTEGDRPSPGHSLAWNGIPPGSGMPWRMRIGNPASASHNGSPRGKVRQTPTTVVHTRIGHLNHAASGVHPPQSGLCVKHIAPLHTTIRLLPNISTRMLLASSCPSTSQLLSRKCRPSKMSDPEVLSFRREAAA